MFGLEVQKEYNPASAYDNGVVEAVDGVGAEVPEGTIVILHVSSAEAMDDSTQDDYTNEGWY